MHKKIAAPTASTRIDYYPLYSPQLGRWRQIRVLLPPDFFRNSLRRFPVVYMQDGQNLFEHTKAFGGHSWHITATMQKLPRMYQAIVVGIDHGGVDRIHEYTPFQRGNNHAQGDAYLRFLGETVKPFVDTHYRTNPSSASTGIAGSSMGGLIAMYAGLKYGAVFGKVGVFSPSFWYSDRIFELAEQPVGTMAKIYVIGSKTESRHMDQQLQKTYWALRKGGFAEGAYRVTIRDRGRHNEVFWGREFGRMMRFFNS